jgi:tetratricopeptide (TPR) repeat protein
MGLMVVWWERYHQGTRGGQFNIGLLERALIVGRGLWFYAGKLLWPSDLTFIYPRWNPMAADPLAYAWLVAAIAVGVAIYFGRRYAGRGVEVGVAFYVATLSPVLGFVMLYTFRYTFVADHYQYLASLGLIALAVAGLARLAAKWRVSSPVTSVVAALLLLLLGGLTWRQAHAFESVETLWHDTLAKNPNCWMAYNNLGLAYYEDGRVDEAIAQYEKSLGFDPSNAEALNNLGNALRKKGNLDEAIARYQKALEIKPDFSEADNNLGNAFLQKGDVDEAIVHYERAAKIRPDFATFQWNLGKALFAKRKYKESIAPFEAALRVTPNSAEAHGNLATSLMAVQRNDEAIQHFREALHLKSNYVQAHYFLGCLLAERGQRDEGVAHLKMVLRLQPSHADARQQLSLLGVQLQK